MFVQRLWDEKTRSNTHTNDDDDDDAGAAKPNDCGVESIHGRHEVGAGLEKDATTRNKKTPGSNK